MLIKKHVSQKKITTRKRVRTAELSQDGGKMEDLVKDKSPGMREKLASSSEKNIKRKKVEKIGKAGPNDHQGKKRKQLDISNKKTEFDDLLDESTASKKETSKKKKLINEVDDLVSADGDVDVCETAEEVDPNIVKIVDEIQEKADKALDVLVKVAERQKNKTLFPEIDHALSVMCIYKKPSAVLSPILRKKVSLPHPYYNQSNAALCMILPDITPDIRKNADYEKDSREWERILLEDHKVTKKDVHKVLSFSHLCREYSEYHALRNLANAYDIFLCEKNIGAAVQKRCGKTFYERRKSPVLVDLNKGNLLEQIHDSYAAVFIPLSACRTRVSLHFGHLGQSRADILENLRELLMCFMKCCPGGELNIRSIYMRINSFGPCIPIYADLGSANEVHLPTRMPKQNLDDEIIGEISTLPNNLLVKIRKDGKIDKVNSETEKLVRSKHEKKRKSLQGKRSKDKRPFENNDLSVSFRKAYKVSNTNDVGASSKIRLMKGRSLMKTSKLLSDKSKKEKRNRKLKRNKRSLRNGAKADLYNI